MNYHCSLCTICRSAICIAHVVKIVPEERYALVRNYGALRPRDSTTMLREIFSRQFPPVRRFAAVL